MITEERLIDLETKMTYQENTLDTLQQLVYVQQKKITELGEICAALAARLKEMAAGSPDQAALDEKPPHY